MFDGKLTNDPLAPIGIFDSGIGGLSVLQHIHHELPNESLTYFADSGFAPYGDKSEAEIVERTDFIAQYLLEQGVKAIVVACNAATASSIAFLRSQYPDLILVGVEPGLKPAANLTKTKRVGVLATSRTLASSKYQLLCEQIQQTTHVQFINQACPGLVPQIESGDIDSETTLGLLTDYLEPIFDAEADVLVLGCTHYPFLESAIKRVAQKKNNYPIQLIDTGLAITKQLKRLLAQQHLLNEHQVPSPIQCKTTGDTALLKLALSQLLNLQPEQYNIK